VSISTVIRPSACIACNALTLASFAVLHASERCAIVPHLRGCGSAARPSAFSIPASPAPITTMCSSTYSAGSSSWYCTTAPSPTGQRTRLGLPCVPIASTTASARIGSPFFTASVKSPFAPVIETISVLSRTLTWCPAVCSSHVPSTASRLPASKSRSLRSTRLLGVAMTCLPFWYLWIVSLRCPAFSTSTWLIPRAAARAAALSPAGPEPTIATLNRSAVSPTGSRPHCKRGHHKALFALRYPRLQSGARWSWPRSPSRKPVSSPSTCFRVTGRRSWDEGFPTRGLAPYTGARATRGGIPQDERHPRQAGRRRRRRDRRSGGRGRHDRLPPARHLRS